MMVRECLFSTISTLFPKMCYRMEGIGDRQRRRGAGGFKGLIGWLLMGVMGVRRRGAPVIPEMLLRLRDFS